jgi:hypothetical protein
MPEITQNYELRKPGPTPGIKYPLQQWIEGIHSKTIEWRKRGCKGDQPTLRLTQGTDYEIASSSMAEGIWKYRRDRELPIRLAVNPDCVLVFWDGSR